MSWWLFIQLFLLIVLVGLVVAAVSENFTDNLYENRDKNEQNRRLRDAAPVVTHLIKDSSES